MQERCITRKTGSCLGCKVQDEALIEMRKNGQRSEELLKLLSRKNCPDGFRVQISRRPRSI